MRISSGPLLDPPPTSGEGDKVSIPLHCDVYSAVTVSSFRPRLFATARAVSMPVM
jgi:hypothetical protein